MSTESRDQLESVESFRARARVWIAENLRPVPPLERHDGGDATRGGEAVLARSMELQRLLYEGGFAGICYPREYGGLGLTGAHHDAFSEEAEGYEMPSLAAVMSTLGICGPTILDMGSEELKQAHLPAIIRGEEFIAQFMSEPGGGSDLAGATTRATRDGDSYIVNGAKIWSSNAQYADYGFCLVRTDWDVPKHRGLSVLLMKVPQDGITIRPIKQVNGESEFCEEFFDNVRVPVANLVGAENDGWNVMRRLLFHEHNAVSGASPYLPGTGSRSTPDSGGLERLKRLARDTGQANDPRARELVAEWRMLAVIHEHLNERVAVAIDAGMPHSWATLSRLLNGEVVARQAEIAIELGGPQAMTPESVESDVVRSYGVSFLFRQAFSIGGGTMEMARNMISERILGMPREPMLDKDVPFSQAIRSSRPSARPRGSA